MKALFNLQIFSYLHSFEFNGLLNSNLSPRLQYVLIKSVNKKSETALDGFQDRNELKLISYFFKTLQWQSHTGRV